ncbi:neuroparsin-A-like isoform X2 [Cloeon dipterum]|uniref:neuroparsin-A-like isoform X2 n=1 Tax=Cloeon dipterum TaxID=197152 RepID=UPI00322014FB
MQASLYKYSVISLASTLFGLLVIASIMTTAQSGPTRCGPCLQGTCVSNPDDCRYGHFHDSCGRIVCSKGPDEKCGGLYDYFGRCGHGLVCRCNQCVGCSEDTMECSTINNPNC